MGTIEEELASLSDATTEFLTEGRSIIRRVETEYKASDQSLIERISSLEKLLQVYIEKKIIIVDPDIRDPIVFVNYSTTDTINGNASGAIESISIGVFSTGIELQFSLSGSTVGDDAKVYRSQTPNFFGLYLADSDFVGGLANGRYETIKPYGSQTTFEVTVRKSGPPVSFEKSRVTLDWQWTSILTIDRKDIILSINPPGGAFDQENLALLQKEIDRILISAEVNSGYFVELIGMKINAILVR